MTLRILESLRRLIDVAIARKNERIADRAYHQRCVDGRHWVGGFICFIAISLTACGPSRATRTAIDEVIVMDVRCATELDELHFEPGPNIDADARQQAVLAGCQERAFAFCAAHHITHADTELCP